MGEFRVQSASKVRGEHPSACPPDLMKSRTFALRFKLEA